MYAPELPLAIVEAKGTEKSMHAGLQQAMEYAEALDVPFAYSTNGKGFVEHDFITGKECTFSMDEFPAPEELWARYRKGKALEGEYPELVMSAPITKSMVEILHVTTNVLQSIERLKLSPGAKIVSYLLWLQGRARPTPRSR